MKYVHEEFIKFQSDFSNEKTDFYGENSPLNKEEFKDFLREYLTYGKKKYGENFLCEKAVSNTQIQSSIEGVNCCSELEFSAYKRPQKSKYQNWLFYTDRASAENGVVSLKENYSFPVPAAKYEFENGVTRLSFAVKIGLDYKAFVDRLYDTTTGRQVEFRFGCEDCIRLYFAPDGTIAYKRAKTDFYHPEIIVLGKYQFDEWTKFELEIKGAEFSIRVQDTLFTFPYPFEKLPDTLYLGGGMQPTKEWFVEILEGQDEKGEKIDFFKAETVQSVGETSLGKVRLPFVIGTQKNKDCELVLRTSFSHKLGERSILKLQSLDPGGVVFVNGVSVVRKDDFQPAVLDITKWCQEGNNQLEIVVFPRAPEILYNWHRHQDYYNGWFSLDAEIEQAKLFIPTEVVVKTLAVGEQTKFSVFWDTEQKTNKLFADIYLRKSYPVKGEWEKIGEATLVDGVLNEEFSLPVDLWDTDTPNLYEVEVKLYEKGNEVFSSLVETGFRIIEQKEGAIYLNGKKLVLKGALNMQFLPPYEEVPLTHLCPSVEQIAEQLLAIKNMNGNCLRMHQLGYGSNDNRIAKLADRLGVTLIWTTRLIDSVENLQWTETWKQRDGYLAQIKQVINHPSIIIYEGSNELHTDLPAIDRIYKEFVSAVAEVDDTRLLSPVSHLYYGGGLYENGTYYNDAGTQTESGESACATLEWTAKGVLRSAHTYCLLLGYGGPWQDMLTQNWKWQDELFNSQERAYIISEFAVIGRQNPTVPEAKDYFNPKSYELADELMALGFQFNDDEWELSQAFQAICTAVTVKKLKACDADGMLWCSLWGGANDGGYLKPIIDFYGYKKYAFYALKDGFAPVGAFHAEPLLLWTKTQPVSPLVYAKDQGRYAVTVEVLDSEDNKIAEKTYSDIFVNGQKRLESFIPNFNNDGYYKIRYTVEEK